MKLASKLRIGEKIGLGFGFVAFLFLIVIWQYNNTLSRSLADYQDLQDTYGAKKSHALLIENHMLNARQFENRFLIHRDEDLVQQVDQEVERILEQTRELATLDQSSAKMANRLAELTRLHHHGFQSVVEAWQTKGLDHNSGLQGAFRDTAHELERMASGLDAGRLYLQLLQIRRAEKDLGLRREDEYRVKALYLVDGFRSKLEVSKLSQETKDTLLKEIDTYRLELEKHADSVLTNADIHDGKGPFRDVAHRIEAVLNSHYVPDLEGNILQLRRREKDYLLRGDMSYVEMVQNILGSIGIQVDLSAIPNEKKTQFVQLLKHYENNFLALVDQNKRIDQLILDMRDASEKVSALVRENVISANRAMIDMTEKIHATSKADAHLMLWVAAIATLLGVLFAYWLTVRITRPLRKMTVQLEQMAYEAPADRLSYIPGGRDEVNIMAESVDTMVKHRSRFIRWWKASMREADVYDKLGRSLDAEGMQDVDRSKRDSLRMTLQAESSAKEDLLAELHQEIDVLNEKIVDQATILRNSRLAGDSASGIDTIWRSANTVRNILEMVLFQAKSKNTSGDTG